jgi:hypothetical protein
MADLRQQLQSMKKQTMTALEQARKSSDREQSALRQAQKSLELEKIATSNAALSAQCKNYILDPMTDASQEMAGTLFLPYLFHIVLLCLSLCHIAFFLYLS